jgi:hypothetical protein
MMDANHALLQWLNTGSWHDAIGLPCDTVVHRVDDPHWQGRLG